MKTKKICRPANVKRVCSRYGQESVQCKKINKKCK